MNLWACPCAKKNGCEVFKTKEMVGFFWGFVFLIYGAVPI
jgi:hypothetical protein